jgi:hypothetical protein
MTEAEWLNSGDAWAMLNWLNDSLSTRKRRLFLVACCRRSWRRLNDRRSRLAVEMAEQYADNTLSSTELQAAHEAANNAYLNAFLIDDGAAWLAVAASALRPDTSTHGVGGHADLLRHVVGNPFRPVVVDPGWLRWNQGVVVQLASAIYEQRLTREMFLLADALEDAGCTDAAILTHCRAGGDHPRGCWLLDLLLGKS